MNWRVKGITQKVLSGMPGGVRVNSILQRTAGGLRHFDDEVDGKVDDWLIVMSHLAELGVAPAGLRYMEIGTGWFPTFPLCFSLAGAAHCHTFDLTAHLSSELTFRMLRSLKSHLPRIAEALKRPADELEAIHAQWSNVSNLQHLLEQARVKYHAPADAARSAIPSGSIDVVYSNSVLEHVPRSVIADLMREGHRVLRSGGLMIHGINCGDHYAYFDRGISAINYLKYSERRWRFWNNQLLHQNRMRPQDFLELAGESGFSVVLKRHKPRAELLAALPRLQIAEEFRGYPPEELCCTSLDFVARRP